MTGPGNLRKAFFAAVARLVTRHPKLLLAVALLLTAVSIYGAANLEIRNNIEDYLPQGSPVVDLFRRAVARYGASDHLVVLVEGKGADDLGVRESIADALAERLREATDPEGRSLVASLEYKVGEDLIAFYQKAFLKNTLLYLDEKGLEEFKTKLTEEAIFRQMQENRDLLLSPSAALAEELVTRDPYNLRTLFLERLLSRRGNLQVEYHDGYLTSHDLTWLILVVKPVRPAQDVRFARILMERVERAGREAIEAVRSEGDEIPPSVRIRSTGGYAIAVEYDGIIKRDLGFNILTAFLGVMLLFVISFRRIGALFYVGIPLLMGLSWTFGLVYLIFGRINLFTGASAAVLLGLGIDFAIHLVNRYLVEMERDGDEVRSITTTLVDVGNGAAVACGTSILAFYVSLAADFDGLRQLGLISGTGLLLCFIANFTVLPAFLVVSHRVRPDAPGRELTGFYLEPLERAVTARAGWIVAIFAVLTIGLGVACTGVRLDEDFRNFRPQGSAAVELQREMIRKIGSPLVYTMILVEGKTEEEALRVNEEVARQLNRLIEEKTVASYISLDAFVPPPAQQARSLRWLERQRREDPQALSLLRIERATRRAMTANGFRVEETLPDAMDTLSSILSVNRPLDLDALMGTALNERIGRFVSQNENGGYEVVTYVYASMAGGLDQKEAEARIEAALQEVRGKTYVISVNLLGRELKQLIKKDALRATALALAGILGLLYFHYRRLRLVLLTGIPLLVGLVWAIGWMTLFGLALNLVSVGMIPIILGIGIDNGIYLTNRYRELGPDRVGEVFHDTGRAVVMTSLTTMWGFGSMALAKYKGLVAAGVLAALGVGSCLFTAIVLLPALVQLGRERWFR